MPLKRGNRHLRHLSRVRSTLGRQRRYDVRLYGEVLRAHPELDNWLPQILEGYRVTEGAMKRTEDDRFQELDTVLFDLLPERWNTPLRVHDVGASDGRTSVQLYQRLRARGPVDYTASDYNRDVWVVGPSSGRWSVAFDESHTPVQYSGFSLVLSAPEPDNGRLYPYNAMIRRLFERRLVPAAKAALAQAPPVEELSSVQVGSMVVERIPMVCRACRELASTEDGFRHVHHDVREPLNGPFDLVRVMNVLNHLSPADRARAAGALRAQVADRGLLVVGRNVDPSREERATVWQRNADELEVVARLHGGTELHDVIEEDPASSEAVSP